MRDNKEFDSYSLCGCSDEYTQLFPFAQDPLNPGFTVMKTADQVREENITIVLVNKQTNKFSYFNCQEMIPPAPYTVRHDEGHSGFYQEPGDHFED